MDQLRIDGLGLACGIRTSKGNDSGVLAEQATRIGLVWVADELKQQSETLSGLSGTVLEDIMIKQPRDAELHKIS